VSVFPRIPPIGLREYFFLFTYLTDFMCFNQMLPFFFCRGSVPLGVTTQKRRMVAMEDLDALFPQETYSRVNII
jgi:hypothetical protein